MGSGARSFGTRPMLPVHADTGGEELNNLERALGKIVGSVPFLGRVFNYFGYFGSGLFNLAEAGVKTLQGKTDEAARELGSAFRSFADFATPGSDLLFDKTFSRPEDFSSGTSFLKTMGAGKLGEVDLPLIGKVSGRGALGFGLDILGAKAIPRIGARIPGAPKIGPLPEAAVKPGLARAPYGLGFARSLPKSPAEALGDVALGNRALVSLGKTPIIRDIPLPTRLGGSMMELIDTAKRGIATLPPFSWLNTHGGLKRLQQEKLYAAARAAEGKGRTVLGKPLPEGKWLAEEIPEEAARILKGVEDYAERHGLDEATAYEHLSRVGERRIGSIPKVSPEQPWLMQGAAKKARDDIKALYDDYRKPVEQGGHGLSKTQALRAAKMAHSFPGMERELAPIAAEGFGLFRDILRTEQQAGLAVAHLADPYLNYVTHALTPEFKALLAANKTASIHARKLFEERWGKHPSQLRRKAIYEGYTIPEMNELFARWFPDMAAKGIRAFEDNPLKIVAQRSRRMTQGLRTVEFAVGSMDHYGRPLTPTLKAAGWQDLESIISDPAVKNRLNLSFVQGHLDEAGNPIYTRLGAKRNLAVPPDVAQAMKKTLVGMTGFDYFQGIRAIELFDKLTRAFKFGATTYFPEFHIRNAFSNAWASGLDNAFNPNTAQWSVRKMGAWMRGKLDPNEVVDLGPHGPMPISRLIQRAENLGSFKGQYGPEEIGKGFKAVLPKEGFFPAGENVAASALKAPFRGAATGVRALGHAGGKGGQAVDNGMKLSHIIEKMRHGESLEQAIVSMKKHLFDYSDLSTFERSVMKRIVPFYTWSRFNLPLALESLATRPDRVAQLALVQRALLNAENGQPAVDTMVVPEWIRRRLHGIRKIDDDSISIFSGLGFGIEDLGMFNRPVKEFLSMLSPMLKAPLQYATNKDFFRDTDLDRSEIAPPMLRWMEAVPGVGKAFLDAIDFRVVKDKAGEAKYARANPRFLNGLRGLLEVGGVSRAMTVLDNAAGIDRPTDPTQPLKFLTSVRVQRFSVREQMRQQMISMLETYQKEIEKEIRAGRLDEFKSFYVERDLVATDPKVKLAGELLRARDKVLKALSEARKAGEKPYLNEEAVLTQRQGLRSGGQ